MPGRAIVPLEVRAHRAQTARRLFRARANHSAFRCPSPGVYLYHVSSSPIPVSGRLRKALFRCSSLPLGDKAGTRNIPVRSAQEARHPAAGCEQGASSRSSLRSRAGCTPTSLRNAVKSSSPPCSPTVPYPSSVLPYCRGRGGRTPFMFTAGDVQYSRRWCPDPVADLRDRIAPRPFCPGHIPSFPKGTRPHLGPPAPS